jgi:ATP synthase protein I
LGRSFRPFIPDRIDRERKRRGASVDLQDPRPKKNPGAAVRQVALAMELPFLLVGPAVVGGAIGYFLDVWLHTKPWIMLVLGLCGVGAGLFNTLKAAGAGDKKNG